MNPTQEQLVALGGVFLAAVLVDKIAKTGQVSEADLACMLGSLLVRDPKDTLEVFGVMTSTCARATAPLSVHWSATPIPCNANRCAMPCRCSTLSVNWPSATTCWN